MANPIKSVLVTGASTGIGRAVASRLDRLGFRVYAGVRRPEDGEALRAEASERLSWLRLDVTDPADVGQAAETIVADQADGGLDALVNNAGIAVGGPLEFVDLEAFRRQFEVNVTGLLAVTQAVLPMLRRRRGRIVNIGSIAGRSVAPMVGPYCASKHAVEALTDGLRLELHGTGIEVSVVEPGAVKTPIWGKGIDQFEAATGRLPQEAVEYYGAYLRFFVRLLELNDRGGVPADQVADAVEHALTAERPKTRYLVGRDATLRAWVRRLLPDRWHDALVRARLRQIQERLG